MRALIFRPLVVAAMFAMLPAIARAQQQRPTPEQAQQILQNRPDLAQQLRQRIQTSGMTPDQIRARLRAEGYPESMLDAYLAGGDSTSGGAPSDSVFAAVAALGLADSLDLTGMRGMGQDTMRMRQTRPEIQTTWADFRDVMRGPVPTDTMSVGGREVLRPGRRDSTTDTLDIRGLPQRTLSLRPLSPADMPADSGYKLFGLDLFRGGSTQFQANLAGPVDANYRLGPGDRLVLILTGDVEASYSLDVTREGFVVIPQVGRVDVNGLTLGQLEDVLYTRLGRVYSGVRRGGGTTRFSITPARLRTNQIYVVGDVRQPGSYQISAAGTALTALYAAGGPTTTGSLRQISIRRAGRTVATLDVYDYLLRGDATNDVRLETGDIVFVPVHGPRVRVTGQVVRPATYEMKPGETLGQVIDAAGGFSAIAARRRVQIERIVPPGQRSEPGRDQIVIDVASQQLADGVDGPGIPMMAGDIVHVFPITERVRDRVAVKGNVWAPGAVGYTPGMRVSDALRLAGGVKPDVYLGEVLVTRLQSDSSRVQLRTSLADTLGHVVNDFPLLEDDEIQTFSVTEFRPERYVAITGAVRKPGRYAFRRGMRLRDLVLLAGGLEQQAYLQAAEVARLPEDRTGGKLATTIRVPLDSSYLFERSPDGKYYGPPGLPAPSGPAPDVPLEPYDNVLILEQPDWDLQRSVKVMGEVRFPGTYSLTTKGERLRDVIERAGGLTSEGYADGVYFYRRKDRLGRIGIDLPRVLRDSRTQDNLILMDGDSVFVPQTPATVNVKGAVNSPVAVAYVPGKNIDYYINAAGGLTPKAAGNRSYVTQPNGKVQSVHRRLWLPDGKPKPRAGSTVFVPERDVTKGTDLLQVLSVVTPILTGLATVVVLVQQATKK